MREALEMSPKNYRQEMTAIDAAEQTYDISPKETTDRQRRALIRLTCHRFAGAEEIRDGLLILKELIETGDFESLWPALAAALASAVETCISDAETKRSLEGAEQSS